MPSACAALALLLPVQANALELQGLADAADTNGFACATSPEQQPVSAPVPQTGITTKSAAILGGQPSALDLIRQQQGGLFLPSQTATAPIIAVSQTMLPTPDACSLSLVKTSLPTAQLAAPTVQPAVLQAGASDNFLGSARVGIGRTPFSDDWARVSNDELSRGAAQSLTSGGSQPSMEALTHVNRWVNQTIAFGDDSALYGQRDYWATADETLAVGSGDCEDFAILKYQMLTELGFDRSDMYLTLARDLVRNADHAVLIVRINGQHYMLDNATDAVLLADRSHDYRATISFNSESAWLHGYTQPAPPSQFAYLSDNAVSSALVTGLNK